VTNKLTKIIQQHTLQNLERTWHRCVAYKNLASVKFLLTLDDVLISQKQMDDILKEARTATEEKTTLHLDLIKFLSVNEVEYEKWSL